MTMAVAPENVTEEDEIVQRVLELSLRHEEERRAAQAAAEIEEYEALAADVTEERLQSMNDWLRATSGRRIDEAVESLGEEAERREHRLRPASGMSLEEQLAGIKRLSRTEARRKSSPGGEEDDEELEKGLALSMDPSQQSNVDVASFLAGLRASLAQQQGMNVAQQVPPEDDHVEEDENDEELQKAISVSKREKAREDLQDMYDTLEEAKKFQQRPKMPRPIVIDGCNVAWASTQQRNFGAKGILRCYQYFKKRGHEDIVAFAVPRPNMEDRDIYDKMVECGYIIEIDGGRHYDDLFVISAADKKKAIVVSNDRFRDVMRSSPEFADQINKRVLKYKFAGEDFVPAEDPLGRFGPSLDAFLKF